MALDAVPLPGAERTQSRDSLGLLGNRCCLMVPDLVGQVL